MDAIPLEIISTIAEQLEQLNISADAFSHFTQTSKEGPVIWFSHTPESRQDVCSFRLVCRKFYNGSLKSIGKVLGDRKFRITKVALQDLQGIAKVEALMPYIRTITFGTAYLVSNSQFLKRSLEFVEDKKVRDRIYNSYENTSNWAYSEQIQLLTTTLEAFSNLKSLRLVVDDRIGEQESLADWLEPGDNETLQSAFSRAYPSSSGHMWDYVYDTGHMNRFVHVFKALSKAGIGISDLRVNQTAIADDFPVRMMRDYAAMFSNLHTIQLCIRPSELESFVSESSLVEVLKLTPRLSCLSLTMDEIYDQIAYREKHDATKILLQTLSTHSQIERVSLKGEWSFVEDDLIAFITSHAATLRCIILGRPCMSMGSWRSAITQIFHLQLPKMEFVQFVRPTEERIQHYGSFGAQCIRFREPRFYGSEFDSISKEITYPFDLQFKNSRYILGPA